MITSQRQKKKLETRKIIIDTALDQFAKDGLINTRTSDIAAMQMYLMGLCLHIFQHESFF